MPLATRILSVKDQVFKIRLQEQSSVPSFQIGAGPDMFRFPDYLGKADSGPTLSNKAPIKSFDRRRTNGKCSIPFRRDLSNPAQNLFAQRFLNSSAGVSVPQR